MKMAFINVLSELAERDQRVMLLTGDLGFGIFDDFASRFQRRYVNVGVAESQLIMAAAGMAAVGLRPFTYSIASFATCRCYEQIKLAVAYPRLPVTVVGAGGGYAYSSSGVTHHAGEDISLLCALPEMIVVAPGDADELAQLMPQMYASGKGGYLRIGRGREKSYSSADRAVLGKARLLRNGERMAVLSTGEVASEVVDAIDMLKSSDITPAAYQYHTVKPLDVQTLDYLAESMDAIVTVEEHVAGGGFGSQVASWLAARSHKSIHVPLSVGDKFVLGSPARQEFRKSMGLDASGLARSIASVWNASARISASNA